MRISHSLSVLALMALSACATGPRDIPTSIECPLGANGGCNFANAPVPFEQEPVTLPNRPYVFSRTLAPLGFVDATRANWNAPARTLTDGASIPPIFVPIVGDPRDEKVLSAAVMHDAYCGVGNEDLPTYRSQSWQRTHEMFYDALISGGAEPLRAKLMFAAVYLGGPRWPAPRAGEALAMYAPSYDGLPRTYTRERDLSRLPVATMQTMMRRVKRYIETAQPTPNRLEIIRYIEFLERTILQPELAAMDREERQGAAPATAAAPAVTPPAAAPTPPPATPTPTAPTNPPPGGPSIPSTGSGGSPGDGDF